MNEKISTNLTISVQKRYASLAVNALSGQPGNGCADNLCKPVSENLYDTTELAGLPSNIALVSLGCGNPLRLTQLNPGETVLDLGSGGGLDVLLSARRVGPTGFVYGLDMTDEMLELARRNARDAGADNVAFLKGDIAAVPLPDNIVDVIISNCVINLAVDKAAVIREAYRLLKTGGTLAVSDLVLQGNLPEHIPDTPEQRREISSWAGAIAGVLTAQEYHQLLFESGFSDIEFVITRRYSLNDLAQPFPAWVNRLGLTVAENVLNQFSSCFVRARKA